MEQSDKPSVWLHGEVKTPPFGPAGPVSWRIVYHVTTDAVVILEVFRKTTRRTPGDVIIGCRRRLQR